MWTTSLRSVEQLDTSTPHVCDAAVTSIGTAVMTPWPISIWVTMTVMLSSEAMRNQMLGAKTPPWARAVCVRPGR